MSQRILIENAGVIKVNPEAGIGESVEVVFFRRQTKQETIEKNTHLNTQPWWFQPSTQ